MYRSLGSDSVNFVLWACTNFVLWACTNPPGLCVRFVQLLESHINCWSLTLADLLRETWGDNKCQFIRIACVYLRESWGDLSWAVEIAPALYAIMLITTIIGLGCSVEIVTHIRLAMTL